MTRTLYIDGGWRQSIDGAIREIHSPAYGTLVKRVSEAGIEDALAAIASARSAFDRGDFLDYATGF
jgi:betaine-aldehyde dehydrogenase